MKKIIKKITGTKEENKKFENSIFGAIKLGILIFIIPVMFVSLLDYLGEANFSTEVNWGLLFSLFLFYVFCHFFLFFLWKLKNNNNNNNNKD